MHRWIALILTFVLTTTVFAADKVLGTFTVKGKTTRFDQVYATRQADPANPSQYYVIVLLSDAPIAAMDRVPDRLLALGREGKVRALRVVWAEGLDRIQVTPYHPDVEEIGQPMRGAAVFDIKEFDEREFVGGVKSKMLGQEWHFNATIEAALVAGGPAVLEVAVEEPQLRVPAGKEGDPNELKRALGRLGYDYKPETFVRAVGDGNLDAVNLFLRAGMPPDTKGDNGYHALLFATMSCMRGEPGPRVGIIKALVDAKANPNVRDMNDSTPLIWAAQQCPLEAIQALIAGGADVNARAKGGATPLMMAEVMQKADVAEALRKAGAKAK
jgi:hypothetical protein